MAVFGAHRDRGRYILSRMKSKKQILCLVALTASACATGEVPKLSQIEALPALPAPVANNAVVSLVVDNEQFVISFAGLAAGREHDDVLDKTWVYRDSVGDWQEAAPVPGGVGRLAAVAAGVNGLAYVFGGYTVAADGSEVSTPWVHTFDPETGVFSERATMPVPVDDAVAVVYQDRYIYLISGWHDLGNVNLVQRYDTETDTWVQATPTPGPGVFGHAGGILDGQIVYCDGVAIEPHPDKRRDFAAIDNCYRGIIDEDDSRRIDWRTLPPHPGLPRYRMAAAGSTGMHGVLFIGGSANPYNYNGTGYDGQPSEPETGALLFDFMTGEWRVIETTGVATMDHRGLVLIDGKPTTIGGMRDGQSVIGESYSYSLAPPR